MNTTQAMTQLRKLLGPKAGLRDTKKPTSPELREEQRARRLIVNAQKKEAEEALEARRKAVLAADPEYQRLHAAWRAARDLQEMTPHGTCHRYTAGIVGSMFFVVKAEADTLDELVTKCRDQKAAA